MRDGQNGHELSIDDSAYNGQLSALRLPIRAQLFVLPVPAAVLCAGQTTKSV
jgi:hypothetical protein